MGLGVLAVAPALLATLLRLFPPTEDGPALLAAFIPYGTFGYLVGVLCFGVAAARARGGRTALVLLTAVGLAGLLLHLAWLGPRYVRDARPTGGQSVTVVSLNIENASVSPGDVVEQTRSADLVILVEVTGWWHNELDTAGWRQRFPYAAGAPTTGGTGTVVYSRFPLSASEPLPPTSFQQWATTADMPGIGPVRVVAVHPCNPFCGGNRWHGEHASLRGYLQTQPDMPLLVAGDFNAVDDHGPLQRLRADGLRSAADLAGSGWLPTYPANRPAPPLLAIDHVLVNQRLTATAAESFQVAGTDHLGLRTTIAAVG